MATFFATDFQDSDYSFLSTSTCGRCSLSTISNSDGPFGSVALVIQSTSYEYGKVHFTNVSGAPASAATEILALVKITNLGRDNYTFFGLSPRVLSSRSPAGGMYRHPSSGYRCSVVEWDCTGTYNAYFASISYSPTTWYWMRVRSSSGVCYLRIWAYGDEEPTSWNLSPGVVDNFVATPGFFINRLLVTHVNYAAVDTSGATIPVPSPGGPREELQDASLKLGAFSLSLDDFASFLRAHDGLEFEDFRSRLIGVGLELEDLNGFLSAYYQSMEDAPLFLWNFGEVLRDLQAKLGAIGLSVEVLPFVMNAIGYRLEDFGLKAVLTDGVALHDFQTILEASRGETFNNIRLSLRTRRHTSSLKTVRAQRTGSVTRRVSS